MVIPAGDTGRIGRFEFATAGRIIFGSGSIRDIGPAAAGLGRKALITTGLRERDQDRLSGLLDEAGVSYEFFRVSGEPTVDLVLRAVEAARAAGCDLLIGYGGGSAIDTAKAAAALLTNPGDPMDYLEVVGRGLPILIQPMPLIAVPTTAGTGSEVTRNAVLSVPGKGIKVSLRSPMMLARVAIIDPDLTLSLPPAITASTGMDALAQVIEPYVSRKANPLTDLYCRAGITAGSAALLTAYRQGENRAAREAMAYTSLMGGLALANAGLGAVHGFAGPLGGMFDAPHGAVCAALLPSVVQINAQAIRDREPENPALARYTEIARLVTDTPDGGIDSLVSWLADLRNALNIPGLSHYGVSAADLAGLVDKAAGSSSIQANPIKLTAEELHSILDMAL